MREGEGIGRGRGRRRRRVNHNRAEEKKTTEEREASRKMAERTGKELAEAIDLELRRVTCFRCFGLYAVGEIELAYGVYRKEDVHESEGWRQVCHVTRVYPSLGAVVWEDEEGRDRWVRVMACKKWCWKKWAPERLSGDGEGVFPLCATTRRMRAYNDISVSVLTVDAMDATELSLLHMDISFGGGTHHVAICTCVATNAWTRV
jgi:hypothetical protein